MDSNFDSYKISKKVMDLSLKNGVKFLPNTEVLKFEMVSMFRISIGNEFHRLMADGKNERE